MREKQEKKFASFNACQWKEWNIEFTFSEFNYIQLLANYKYLLALQKAEKRKGKCRSPRRWCHFEDGVDGIHDHDKFKFLVEALGNFLWSFNEVL